MMRPLFDLRTQLHAPVPFIRYVLAFPPNQKYCTWYPGWLENMENTCALRDTWRRHRGSRDTRRDRHSDTRHTDESEPRSPLWPLWHM